MLLHIDHELQQEGLEAVREGHLLRIGCAELFADGVRPVVASSYEALNKVSRCGLDEDPSETRDRQLIRDCAIKPIDLGGDSTNLNIQFLPRMSWYVFPIRSSELDSLLPSSFPSKERELAAKLSDPQDPCS